MPSTQVNSSTVFLTDSFVLSDSLDWVIILFQKWSSGMAGLELFAKLLYL